MGTCESYFVAERVGFEPTYRLLTDNSISSRARYGQLRYLSNRSIDISSKAEIRKYPVPGQKASLSPTGMQAVASGEASCPVRHHAVGQQSVRRQPVCRSSARQPPYAYRSAHYSPRRRGVYLPLRDTSSPGTVRSSRQCRATSSRRRRSSSSTVCGMR